MSQQAAELVNSPLALAALVVFVVAYALVIAEEFTHLRKSKPVMLAAGLIWVLVGIAATRTEGLDAEALLEHNLTEYAALLLFLLAAMTYVNTLEERNVFAALRSWMVARGLSLRSIFWVTGTNLSCAVTTASAESVIPARPAIVASARFMSQTSVDASGRRPDGSTIGGHA